jgi:hypothetical protein
MSRNAAVIAPVPSRPARSGALTTTVDATRTTSAMLEVFAANGCNRAAHLGRTESMTSPRTKGRISVAMSGTAMAIAFTEASATTSGTTSGM